MYASIFFYYIASPGSKKGKTRKKLSGGGDPEPSRKFSEDELKKISEAFALSDISTGSTGAIPAKEVINVVRTLGQCPTQIEVQELLLEVEIIRRRRTGETRSGSSAKRKGRKKTQDPSKYIHKFLNKKVQFSGRFVIRIIFICLHNKQSISV